MYFHDQDRLTLSALPNELIIHVFINLRTVDLLLLSTVCRRIHDLVVRMFAERLRRVATLHSHSLLLEGYHPTLRLTEPPYPCIYLGTDGLDAEPHSDAHAALPPGQRLRELGSLFSRFRPYRRQHERINPMKHPAGDVPGSRTYRDPNDAARQPQQPRMVTTGIMGPGVPGPSTQLPRGDANLVTRETFEPVIQSAHLEAGVRFTQLCADTTITIAGPKPGLFAGCQYIDKGVLRVFRDWLADRAAQDAAAQRGAHSLVGDDADERDKDLAEDGGAEAQGLYTSVKSKGKASQSAVADVRADKSVLWVGNRYSVGIRFGVRQPRRRPQHSPILVSAEEELPVSYEIEYEELLVRTTDLLLASEKADERQYNSNGKAIVIATFA